MRPSFDPGLSQSELFAIRRALAVETNPNHLVGFASSLSPEHPAAASLLFAKSALLELRPRAKQEALAKSARHAAERLSALVDRASGGVWSGEKALRWIATPVDTGSALANLVLSETDWADAAEALRRASPPPLPWFRFDRLRAAADAAEAFAALRGRRDAYLPLSAALALAQPLDDGESRQYPLAARLQALGFPDAYPLTSGQDLATRAADFQHAALVSSQTRLPIRLVLLARRRAAIANAQIETAARQATSDLVIDPSASLEDVPPAARDLARALLLEVGPDIRVIDPAAARMVFRPSLAVPPTGDRQRWLRVFHREAALGLGR